MTYEVFKKRVSDIISRHGFKVSFRHKDGQHFAHCPEGVTIIGNRISPRVCVKWGSGHSSYIAI